jgi:ectoine hydroxylase
MPVIDDVYPSRVETHPRLIERTDPVVYGQPAAGPLTPAQLAEYERRGFLAMPLLPPAEAVAIDEALLDWTRSDAVRALPEAVTERSSGALRSVFRVHDLHPGVRALAIDPRLCGAARQILGSHVYVHQSRVNLKPGFSGRDFYWHSDFETWHVEDGMPRMRALSVAIALTENRPVNGPLMLVPGSHRLFVACVGATPEDHYKASLKKQEYGVPDQGSLATLVEQGGIEAPVGPPGTAVFFDCNTMHGSNGNITPYPRRNVFLVYNSVDNRLRDPYCGLPPRPEYIATRTGMSAAPSR